MTTFDEYTHMGGVSWTRRLKPLLSSPLACRYVIEHPDEDTDTASRGMLRAVHARVLEPENFGDFVLYTEGARRGKAWEAFRDAHAGKTILNQREWDDTFATVDGIAAHAVTRALLSRVVATETTIRWTDPATSLECKGRADAILDDGSLVDLKGYGSDPHLVSRLVGKHGTHVQLAHYAAGLEAQGKTPPHVYVLSYDTKAPYDVCLAELAPDVRAFGASERDRLMGVLAECMRTNHWPGRCPDIVPITLEDFPGYIRPELGAGDETFTSDDEEIPV